ncbi:MAG: MFS transporter [Sphingomonas sp.]
MFNLVIGFGMYAGTYLVPLFLGRVRGYNAAEIGTTVFIAGVAQFLSVPIAAALSQRVDQRIVIAVGLVLFATGLWLFSFMTPEWGFQALFWPQVVRSFAIMLCIVPSVTMALNGFAGPELRYAAGLFNLMRNLGGAIGIALTTTWLQDLGREHVLRLSEALGVAGRTGGRADRRPGTPDRRLYAGSRRSAADGAGHRGPCRAARGNDAGVRRRVPDHGDDVPRGIGARALLPPAEGLIGWYRPTMASRCRCRRWRA